jgi:hypothetical protein
MNSWPNRLPPVHEREATEAAAAAAEEEEAGIKVNAMPPRKAPRASRKTSMRKRPKKEKEECDLRS